MPDIITDLDIEKSEHLDTTHAAARLANALTDINNIAGEMSDIKKIILSVDNDIEQFSGLENCR